MKYEIVYTEELGFMEEKCVRYISDYNRFLESIRELHHKITSITVDRELIYCKDAV